MEKIDQLIGMSAALHASDIHITENRSYKHRVDGTLAPFESYSISSEELDSFLQAHAISISSSIKSYDCALTVDGIRLRFNFFRGMRGREVVMRILSDTIPEFENLHLAPSIRKIVSMKKGLVLISGVTGSGKTTTIAAIVNEISKTRQEHILTIEQPIEYIFEDGLCKISQREVGMHTPSFTQATVDAMREDPDIIFLGEMRDRDTMENAITLAETGHLVLATLHCRNVAEAVDRIVDTYPPEQQSQARSQTVSVLECIVSQNLVKKQGGGRYCLQEIMYINEPIRNALKEHKPITTIRDAMKFEDGSVKLDDSAIRGIKEFSVDPLEMYGYLQGTGIDPKIFRSRCEKSGIPPELIDRIPRD